MTTPTENIRTTGTPVTEGRAIGRRTATPKSRRKSRLKNRLKNTPTGM
jgi:hypothetical protein